MKSSDTPRLPSAVPVKQIVDFVRTQLDAAHCPPAHIEIACTAAGEAASRAIQAAESRERARIIRWLRAVAQVYAGRSRTGEGADAVYWFDQLEAFSQAADAIARRRHARPH